MQGAWCRNQSIMCTASSPSLCKEVGVRTQLQHYTPPYCRCSYHHLGTYKEVYKWVQKHYLQLLAQEAVTKCPSPSLDLFYTCLSYSSVILRALHQGLSCPYLVSTTLRYFGESEKSIYIYVYIKMHMYSFLKPIKRLLLHKDYDRDYIQSPAMLCSHWELVK